MVVRIERLVFTRCPPHTVGDLVEYLKTVATTLERTCEKFEADRTAGYVTEDGEPIPVAREKVLARRAGGDSFERGHSLRREGPASIFDEEGIFGHRPGKERARGRFGERTPGGREGEEARKA